jgi:predicted TIM-barrel fold metal-dependent hydrolase
MADAGIVGVRMHLIGLDRLPDLTGFDYRRTFRRIADLGWHIHLHAEGDDWVELLPLFEATGARLVIDHLGRPPVDGGTESAGFKAMLESVERGNTWIKASGPHRLGKEKATTYLREIMTRVGTGKLVWGSDCPFVGAEETRYQDIIDWFHDAVPDLEARRNIGGANALKLYFA